MRHKKVELWLSNSIDGKLSEKKKKFLEKHLKECQSCSSFAENIKRIQKEAKSLKRPELSPVYWDEFTSRIRTEISSAQQEKLRGGLLFLKWKWALTSGALLFAIVIGLFLYLTQNKMAQEVYVFSFENYMANIYQEIGNDQELEELFNSVISASIGETLEDSEWAERPDFYENLFLWENLSEEEMRLLESEVKKETKL